MSPPHYSFRIGRVINARSFAAPSMFGSTPEYAPGESKDEGDKLPLHSLGRLLSGAVWNCGLVAPPAPHPRVNVNLCFLRGACLSSVDAVLTRAQSPRTLTPRASFILRRHTHGNLNDA
ncbi:predicted protein [Histoplasma capsulatum G186AR]|uniref:Uncharacterized protein n=1 Tax=Ajellomyces capsulatus (strain G186AR / H82 / ATCC MYA-2454 / RMSCC 2432) TaxID=447093 RepID=C0NJQ6_AJECG|nr:uncharacterized protein HCBG_03386 [Histoplasma capsulatum G186AR]EEH08097.1 predicted protein [Histoplasma capsulatum G186AR]